jgi:hypothetical protein
MTTYTPTDRWLLRHFGRAVVVRLLETIELVAFLGFLLTSFGSAIVEISGLSVSPLHMLELAVVFAWVTTACRLITWWLLRSRS